MAIDRCVSESIETMGIDRYSSILLWPAIAIDGHRLYYCVVDTVYRWTPSPAYFHTYNVLWSLKQCIILCRSNAIFSSCDHTTSQYRISCANYCGRQWPSIDISHNNLLWLAMTVDRPISHNLLRSAMAVHRPLAQSIVASNDYR